MLFIICATYIIACSPNECAPDCLDGLNCNEDKMNQDIASSPENNNTSFLDDTKETTVTTTVVTTTIEEILISTSTVHTPSTNIKELPKDCDKNVNNTAVIPKCYVLTSDIKNSQIEETLQKNNSKITNTYHKHGTGMSFCTGDVSIIKQVKENNPSVTIEEDRTYKVASIQYPISRHLFLMNHYTNYVFNNYFFDNIVFRVLQIERLFRYIFGYYTYEFTGKNVKIYMLDTTVTIDTQEVKNISGRTQSCNIHGDSNLKLLKDKTRGFAKDAEVVVLDDVNCSGEISLSGILQSLENVQKDSKPTILLFGVSGPYSKVLNDVVDNLSKSGIIVITPSGNEHDNSCYYSPGSARHVLNVGSVDKHATISKFSNFGSCVRLYALGEDVYEFKDIKGTSYSASYIAGVVATYLEQNTSAKFIDIWKYLDSISYWNNSYLVVKLPNIKKQEKNRYSGNEDFGTMQFIVLLYAILIALVILIICFLFYFYRQYKKSKQKNELLVDTLSRESLRRR